MEVAATKVDVEKFAKQGEALKGAEARVQELQTEVQVARDLADKQSEALRDAEGRAQKLEERVCSLEPCLLLRVLSCS